MAFTDNWNRRTFLGSLGALVGTIFSGRKAFAFPSAAGGKAALSAFGATGNVYEELGVTTVINGQGTMTVLGGSLMRPEVESVMALAGRHFVNIPELEVAAGKRITEMLKLPADYSALVTCDAAADTPPVSHLWDYANMGYDLIAFSGGKAIRGPQCAGLLVGRKDLVSYALLNNSPHEDTLGRSQKVGKEEIVGMVKALECYLQENHDALNKEWQHRLELVSAEVSKVPGVTTKFYVPDIANHVPHMEIRWDKRISATPREVNAALRKGQPAIVLSTGEEGEVLSLNSFMLQPGEDKIIANAVVAVLK